MGKDIENGAFEERVKEYVAKNFGKLIAGLISKEAIIKRATEESIRQLLEETYGEKHVFRGFSNLTETEKAYLAASFDCDGSFRVTEISSGKRKYYYPRAVFSQRSLLPYKQMKKYGGTIRPVKKEDGFMYRWTILEKSRVKNFLIAIIPYLKSKRKQALLLLNLIILKESVLKVRPELPELKEIFLKTKNKIMRLHYESYRPKMPLEFVNIIDIS